MLLGNKKLPLWKDLVEEFLLEKELNGASERTLSDYRYYLERFFNGFTGKTEADLRKRVIEFFSGKLAPATFNIRRAYLKSFFNWCLRKGILSSNPINFKRRKDEGRARAVPKEVIKKLLELPNRKTFTGLRNFTLILFTLDTGIRPKEALSLKVKDFNLEGKEVEVPTFYAKTRKKRILPLSVPTCVWLKRLIKARPKDWNNEEVPVFCNREGKKLSVASWSQTLERYSKKLGYKITPYDLRHTFAIYSLREGMSPFALQRILGHADLNTTKRYLALTQADLAIEHRKSSPVKLFLSSRAGKIPGKLF